jgi:hypothetical protein
VSGDRFQVLGTKDVILRKSHSSPGSFALRRLVSVILPAYILAVIARAGALPPLLVPAGDGEGLATAHRTTRPDPVQPGRAVKIPFEFVEGLIVCSAPTSRGDLRLIVDTGANATALLGNPRPIEIRIGPKSLRLVPAPVRASVLDQVNKTLPAERRIDGILGEDVLVQFRRVTLDYETLQVEFDP